MVRFQILVSVVLATAPLWAEMSAVELIRMSDKPNDEFRAALINTMGEDNIMKGTAVASRGPDFIFAVESMQTPTLVVDGNPVAKMDRVKGWNMWFHSMKLEAGEVHSFYYEIDGRRKGGATDVPAYLDECYPAPDAPAGSLSEKMVFSGGQVYPGMSCDYWIYVPAQYEPGKPAALMVWQDGQNHVDRGGKAKTLTVMDNLIHQGKMPPTIAVFVAPGYVGERRIHSEMYDPIDDRYVRFLSDELLPNVEQQYDIRQDGYSRAIAGVSSGGICAFNAAWHQPDEFSRVLSLIGSYTSIAGIEDGGELYPFKVRKENVRNIRVWLQDGAGDLENEHGSWPLQNLQLANSLKLKGYDFHLSWGSGTHDPAHGWAELPESLTWLWRDYDPSKTGDVFVADPEERKLPLFRVEIANR